MGNEPRVVRPRTCSLGGPGHIHAMKHSRHARHRPGEADRSVAVVLVAKHAGESDDSVGTHALDSDTDFVRITSPVPGWTTSDSHDPSHPGAEN